jgi:protein-S-isoprenylcysteine O-methyltransferase Ste14
MDPINILAGINLIASFGANLTGAKKGLRSSITSYKEKPKTYLQKFPLFLAVITLIAFVFGLFRVGTFQYTSANQGIRILGLLVYIIFSWVQIWSYKSLGESYSQEIIVMNNHKLITAGPYRIIRHPQYLSQVLMDLGAGLATLSYIVIPLALIEIPFAIMRALTEEKLLSKHLKDAYKNYKSKSGFMIPFIG